MPKKRQGETAPGKTKRRRRKPSNSAVVGYAMRRVKPVVDLQDELHAAWRRDHPRGEARRDGRAA